ncbi:MAG: hypothetical protein IKW62_05235 [Clostridia bacterium]|nr:hypothetical protein [Clostridia bacterium]
MKKSIIATMFALVLTTSLFGCGEKSQHDIYKEIYKRYSNMESFYAAATVTVRSDKSESVYSVRQFYEQPDKFAFFVDSPEEVAGSGYVARGGEFKLKSGTGSDFDTKVAFPDSKNYMFLCDFFEEYYKSEETSVVADNGIGTDKTVMSCFMSDKNPKRFMQSLTVDSQTYIPLTLTTYDIDKNPVIEVSFNDFKRNAKIDQRIFN